MSEGSTALIMITVVVGGYAAYRYYKKSSAEAEAEKKKSAEAGRSPVRTGVAALTRGYYTGACASEFTAPDPRHSVAPFAGFYAGPRGGARHFHERMPHEQPDDMGGSDGSGRGDEGGGRGGMGGGRDFHRHPQQHFGQRGRGR